MWPYNALIAVCILVSSWHVQAAKVNPGDDLFKLDVYRSKYMTTEVIRKQFASELRDIVNAQLVNGGFGREENMNKAGRAKQKMIDKLNQDGRYSYINLSQVIYQNDKNVYITLDVVDKDDASRQFVFDRRKKSRHSDPGGLIKLMHDYLETASDEIFHKGKFPVQNECPVLHCVFGFDDVRLKPYLGKFNVGVRQHKAELIEILLHEENPEWRASAAFLLAHLSDPDEIVNNLTMAINDQDANVRNNAMRVIGSILSKAKIKHFPVKDILKRLDYPAETDRNKASYIILSLITQNKEYIPVVIKYGSASLIANLRMQQPNLHDNAARILEIIGDKKYGDRDYAKWQAWLDQQKNRADASI